MTFKPQTFYGSDRDHVDVQSDGSAASETLVADALARAGDLDAANVTVTVVGDQVVLMGVVAYPEEIAIAGDIAARHGRGMYVDNRIKCTGSIAR